MVPLNFGKLKSSSEFKQFNVKNFKCNNVKNYFMKQSKYILKKRDVFVNKKHDDYKLILPPNYYSINTVETDNYQKDFIIRKSCEIKISRKIEEKIVNRSLSLEIDSKNLICCAIDSLKSNQNYILHEIYNFNETKLICLFIEEIYQKNVDKESTNQYYF